MIALDHILVATDFSEPAEMALAYGRELARRFGATLHVLHVVEDLAPRFARYPVYVGELGRLQAEAEAAARARLHVSLSEDDLQTLHAKAVVLTSTSPSNAIVSYARDGMPRMDCIVMGTHGREGVARLFTGSVADRVVRAAPCPVLMVRRPDLEAVVPDVLEYNAHA